MERETREWRDADRLGFHLVRPAGFAGLIRCGLGDMDGLDFCTVGMIWCLHSRQTSHALIDPHVAGGQSKGIDQ